jgi:hypothetical protein
MINISKTKNLFSRKSNFFYCSIPENTSAPSQPLKKFTEIPKLSILKAMWKNPKALFNPREPWVFWKIIQEEGKYFASHCLLFAGNLELYCFDHIVDFLLFRRSCSNEIGGNGCCYFI